MRIKPDYLEFMAIISKHMPDLTPEQDLQITKMLDQLLAKQWESGYNFLWGKTYSFLHWNNKELCGEWEEEIDDAVSDLVATDKETK